MLQLKKLFIVTVVIMLCILGCQKYPLPKEARKALIGKYELHIGSNQNYDRGDIYTSNLTLLSDSTFKQNCKYKNGTEITLSGTWNYLEGNVNFSKFADCAGVWQGRVEKDSPVSLVVEMSNSPTILLNPDTNIFYKKGDSHIK